jgi:hypothetical protein
VNFLQATQRLYSELGRSGSGPTAYVGASASNLRLFNAVADAWLDIQSDPIGWRWMLRQFESVPLTVAVDSYSAADLGVVDFGRWRMPDDWYSVFQHDPAVSPTQRVKVQYIERDQFERQFRDNPPPAGPPQYWTIDPEDKLIVAPTPDKPYVLRAEYYIEPVSLIADANTPSMPVQFHMLLVWRAMVQIAQFDAAPENVSRASDKEQELLTLLMLDQGPKITINARPLA